jgi:rubrerythrin
MGTIRRFLAHAVRLEAEAARRFDELADDMATHGNQEVERIFRQFADFSRLHLKHAMDRAGFLHLAELPADSYDWPQGESPEAAPWWGVDAMMDARAALELALGSERLGLLYYQSVADNWSDPRVVAMAKEFAEEEQEHVRLLEKMLEAGDAWRE